MKHQIIPEGWETRHAAVLNQTHTATVHIWSGTESSEWTYDPVSKTEIRDRGTRLTDQPVTARVQRLRENTSTTAGTQEIAHRNYLVALDRDLTIAFTNRCQVEIVTSTDPLLTGDWLYVRDIQKGSLRFERHLICTDLL